MFEPDDTVRISSLKHMFFNCCGLITERRLENGEYYYRVNLVIRGCRYASEEKVDVMSLMIPIMVQEFEVELVDEEKNV